MNQVYLLSERLFKDRLMYMLEVLNDFTVYVASIFALALTATDLDEAQNALGIFLVCIVVINLVMNMLVIFGGICVSLKRYCARKIQREQLDARNWDFVHNERFRCECKCYTCGKVPKKTTGLSINQKNMDKLTLLPI